MKRPPLKPRPDHPPTEAEALARYEGYLNVLIRPYRSSGEVDDLLQEARLALVLAHREWDPTRARSFKNFAAQRIHWVLKGFVVQNLAVKVPSHVGRARIAARQLESAPPGSEAALGAQRKLESLARNARLSVAKLTELALAVPEAVDPTDDEDHRRGFVRPQYALSLLLPAKLTKLEARVLLLHLEDYTLEETADAVFDEGLTKTRLPRQGIHQHLQRAKTVTREALE